jgi:holin-like protein
VTFRILRDFAILVGCTLAGDWIARLLPFAFPGSIIGMLLLFAALATGVVKAEWVEQGSGLLIKYMAVMFVPLGVGLVDYLGLLSRGALPFLLSTVAGTFVTLAVVGVVFERVRS